MGWSRGSQGNQYGRSQTSSTTTCSMIEMHISQLYQFWNNEGFSLLDQALLMCEMVDTSTSIYAQVTYAAAIKTKNGRENRKRGYEV